MKMKRTLIKLVYMGFGASLVGIVWVFSAFFLPVGSVDGDTIYHYELNERLGSMGGNAIKNIARDKAFMKAIEKLPVTVTEHEIRNELKTYEERYGGRQELERILLDTQGDIESLKVNIKKNLLAEKAKRYFAQGYQSDENEIKEYYQQNTEKYPAGFEKEKTKIIEDIRAEKGSKKYNEYLQSMENDIVIRIY